ncbi:hypothetical protein [Thiocystis violacea]|uniref:hypothetical protein n=1 Tax=Thiocystis violacea TaxID=13725 RepID=UPI001906F9C4|nr:hypothetical protein [Thiocystis violacea]MBK1722533.1 hypothetical protein [Thiocystis violacea]
MLPPIDISYIADRLNDLSDEIQRAFEDSTDRVEPAPHVLLDGLARLIDIIRGADAGSPGDFAEHLRAATGSDPEVLLEHGLGLLTQLAGLAEQLHLTHHARGVEQLCLPLTCWMLRRGSELKHPEPVVNAAAHLANHLRAPSQLAELYGLLTEVMKGIGIERALELESSNPERPWRILLLNRAIVATRSHQPLLMEESFQSVVEHLREDAPDFFREGMGQVEALDYPPQAREVMRRYFEIWCVGQKLH